MPTPRVLSKLALLALLLLPSVSHADVAVFTRTGPSPTVKHAAAELVRYAEKLTGEKATLGEANYPRTTTDVLVLLDVHGNNPLALRFAGPRMRLPVHPDAFLIKGVRQDDQQVLVISGYTPRAVLYGVYHYLEDVCHVGFFKDGEYIPKLSRLPVDEVDIVESPVIELRQLGGRHTWHVFHEATPETQNFIIDWSLKKKTSWGHSHTARGQLCGMKPLFAPPLANVGIYLPPELKKVLQVFPKAIVSDGFSTWRGPDWYSLAGGYIEDVDEAERVTRIISKDLLETPVPADAPHYYHIYWGAEQSEWSHLAGPMLARMCEVNLERDPHSKFMVNTYAVHDVKEFYRTNNPIAVMNYATDSWFLPPGYRMPGDVASSEYFDGHPWIYMNALSRSDDHFTVLPGYREIIRIAREVVSDPRFANCLGFGLHIDEMSCWLFEDLYSELSWDPRKVTYDTWLDDVSLRRFGKASQANMSRSLRHFIDTGDRSWLYGLNRYRFHYDSLWDHNELFWHGGIARDWFTQVDGGLDIAGFREALEVALLEEDRQRDNALYDLTIIDMYRFLTHQIFKYVIIQLHSSYYRATKAFQADDPAMARPYVAAFEDCARRADLVLEQLVDVLSTRDEYVMMSENSRDYWTRDKKDSYWRHVQNSQRDGFEMIHFVVRPSVQIMIEEHRKLLQASSKNFLEHRLLSPWMPGPEPYFFYLAGADKETRAKERAVIERFIEESIDAPRFQGSTAEACRRGLRNLENARCLVFPDMQSQDEIASNYPLSDKGYRAASWQPIRPVAENLQAADEEWHGEHYVVEPVFYHAQSLYSGSRIGASIWLEDEGAELEFTYRYSGRDTAEPPSSLTLSLMLDKTRAIAWTFLNDGNPDPDVTVMKEDVHSEQLRVGGMHDVLDKAREDSQNIGSPGVTEKTHKVRAVFKDGKVSASVDGRVQLIEQSIPGDYRSASFQIDSYYVSHGPWPILWLKDIRLNDQEVKLYSPDWFLAPAPTSK